ncbi:MAG: DUF362 domain-containing protein [Bacillota bacterium]
MIKLEKVVVKRAEKYSGDIFYKLKNTIDLIGGMEEYVNSGDRVVLKVNLLMGKNPEEAVTTHPEIVKAVAKLVKNAGGKPIIADSPGGPFNNLNLDRAYKISGFKRIAEEENIELNHDTEGKKLDFSNGKIKKSFTIADYARNADLIINLPKLKTHGLTMYTGAVKNLFGIIPGLLKAEYHLNLQEVEHFSEMLVDLAEFISPELTIMDGILGMEGDGPSGGQVKRFNYLIASTSPFAVDVIGAYIMGINPQSKIPTISSSQKRNLVNDLDNIEIIGDELKSYKKTKIPKIEKRSNLIDQKLPDFLSNFLTNILRPRPVFNHDKCVGCGDCVESCPADTINLINSKAVVDLDDCIRCFCCQELCSYNAVEIKRPLLGKLLFS